MPFIGNQPALNFTSFAKQDFSTSATTSYTLDHKVANENEIALFINFVRQEPTTAYTASNNTLTLSSATSASDDMYCVYLGKAVQTVNPPSGSVGSSQVSADLITGQTALASEPADTDEFLVSDAGTIKRIDYSLIKGGGITVADQFRMTANNNSDADITSNIERVDTSGQGGITDNQMSESSGIFTFPLTGIYLVKFNVALANDSGGMTFRIKVTTNNSSYTEVSMTGLGHGADQEANGEVNTLVDVTNTSLVKVKFNFNNFTGSGTTARGDTNVNKTYFTFIRLGDT